MSTSRPPEFLQLHYESLRADALARGPGPGRGLGRALLMQQGVPGWMQAWSTVMVPAARMPMQQIPISDRAQGSGQAYDEVVLVLAAMALRS